MKISLNWLNDYVDLSDQSPEHIAELLSLHTAEVEGVELFGEAIGDVVVGEVRECGKHPDADKLSVTEVHYGADEPATVVCGAPNVQAGLKVAFAPVGSLLPGDLKIKKAKLRGVASSGMICSERELEMSEEHNGILELPADAPVGTKLIEYLGMSDAVLELDNKSLTHRPDLWGHYGFARELAAILGRELKALPVLTRDSMAAPREAGESMSIAIDDSDSCRYYAGASVKLGSKIGASPDWMQNRLRAVGQRPLDAIVDLTNYLLLELGQPTHAFDREKLRGQRIVVRRALADEVLVTLDEQERALTTDDLVIADAEGAVAIAGVMGGANSEVTAETRELLFESAHFHPTRVRRTAHRLALRTEASARFEKMLDPEGAWQAVERFAYLLQEIDPQAEWLGPVLEAGSRAADSVELELDPARTATLLSLELSRDEVCQSLRSVGFQVEDDGAATVRVGVPSWRSMKDVRKPIDLVEEVGRLSGYHRIEARPLHAPIVAPPRDTMREVQRQVARRLMGTHGAYETQGYTFLHEDWAERLNLTAGDFVQVDNPVQDGVRLVRLDPVPSLLEQLKGNWREHAAGALFEIGKGYQPNAEGGVPTESHCLAVALWRRAEDSAHGPSSVFGQARSVAEDLLRLIACPGKARPVRDAAELPAWAHPARALSLDKGAGFVSAVHPRVRAALDLSDAPMAVVCLDLRQSLDRRKQGAHFVSPPRFPAIKCDVSLAMPCETPFAEIDSAIRQAGGKILEKLELFDVYEGGELAASGQRSLAFHAVLRGADRTLGEKEEQKFLSKVAQTAERLGGSLRS